MLSRSETEYDAVGNRTKSIDLVDVTTGETQVTRFEYDERGLLEKTVFPDDTPGNDLDNPITRTEYDAAGQVIAEVDERGNRTLFEYDRAGRLIKTFFPDDTPGDDLDNPFTQTEYDAAGRVTTEIDERQHRTEFRYDLAGNLIETILPDNTPAGDSDNPRILDSYDVAGRRVATTDPLGNVTRFVYSEAGLPTEIILPDETANDDSDNPRIISDYDNDRRLIARTDPEQNTTRFEYDNLGRLSGVIQTNNGMELHTFYDYDELGNLTLQRDANLHETRFEYNGLGRRIATVLPEGQRSTTAYNPLGNVAKTTDFNGDAVVFQFDDRNRLIAKEFPDGTSTQFTYFENGQIMHATDARGTTVFDYDARGRLRSRTDPDESTVNYAYDDSGNRTSVTTTVVGTAPRQTDYTYDAQNRIKTVTDPGGNVTTYTYDLAGNLQQADFPNGIRETRHYDEQNRLIFLENRKIATDDVISSYLYSMDRVGNRKSVLEEDGRRVTYEYDDLYRLTHEAIFEPSDTTASRTISYAYDAVGNRLSRDDSAEGVTSYSYDDNDRLLTETLNGTVTRHEYDDNGNTIRRVDGATDRVLSEWRWDFENHLVAADTDGDGTDNVRYQYDAEGIRVAKLVDPSGAAEEIHYLVDNNRPFAQVLAVYTPSGILKVSYVHGHDLISQVRHGDTGKSFYHVDGLGSTRALSDASGIVTDSYIYDAFGRTIGRVGSTGNVYLFAGEQRDSATGLDYLRARYMDASVGRFVGRDSFAGFIRNPITLHRYLYANADPTTMVDPSGQFSINGISAALGVQGTLIQAASAQFVALRSAQRIAEGMIFAVDLLSFGLGVLASTLGGHEASVPFKHKGSALELSFVPKFNFPTVSYTVGAKYVGEKKLGSKGKVAKVGGEGTVGLSYDLITGQTTVSGGAKGTLNLIEVLTLGGSFTFLSVDFEAGIATDQKNKDSLSVGLSGEFLEFITGGFEYDPCKGDVFRWLWAKRGS